MQDRANLMLCPGASSSPSGVKFTPRYTDQLNEVKTAAVICDLAPYTVWPCTKLETATANWISKCIYMQTFKEMHRQLWKCTETWSTPFAWIFGEIISKLTVLLSEHNACRPTITCWLAHRSKPKKRVKIVSVYLANWATEPTEFVKIRSEPSTISIHCSPPYPAAGHKWFPSLEKHDCSAPNHTHRVAIVQPIVL